MSEIDDLTVKIHQTARNHGFWDKDRNLGEMLMLATSELAEALEEDRAGRPTVWFKHEVWCPAYEGMDVTSTGWVTTCACTPKPEGVLVEVVDCIIRCLDLSQHLASRTVYEVGEVIAMKMAYNNQREHKHGKAY